MKSDLISNVTLAPFTTFNIGGPARYFVEVKTVEEVRDALAFARANSLPIFILGGGSNILISDNGFDGLVILLRIEGITTGEVGDKTFVTVGAGVLWDDFVLWSIENNFSGLECMSGVPGTVGGAVVANLGCYGAQVSDTFISAELIDTQGVISEVQVIKKEECEFSYHDSKFGREKGRYIILRATFVFSTDFIPALSYRDNRFDIAELVKKFGRQPTQMEIRGAVLDIREEKGNLIMKDRISYKCAGSFFHMPFVSADKYGEVIKRAKVLDAEKEKKLRPWAWEQKDGSYKLAPGFLLEYTEFKKGYTRGSVGISPRHTLSIVNGGDASAEEVAELAHDMQEAVKKIFGINLEREVEYVGDIT